MRHSGMKPGPKFNTGKLFLSFRLFSFLISQDLKDCTVFFGHNLTKQIFMPKFWYDSAFFSLLGFQNKVLIILIKS
jgi:hypothetical protein